MTADDRTPAKVNLCVLHWKGHTGNEIDACCACEVLRLTHRLADLETTAQCAEDRRDAAEERVRGLETVCEALRGSEQSWMAAARELEAERSNHTDDGNCSCDDCAYRQAHANGWFEAINACAAKLEDAASFNWLCMDHGGEEARKIVKLIREVVPPDPTSTTARARLDADGTAKPLTEIVAVMPPIEGDGQTVHAGLATHYVARPTELPKTETQTDNGEQRIAAVETALARLTADVSHHVHDRGAHK